ncbi:hypothetical protein JB92DRAFT_3133291 [Gautieria morchelliformis]|nr:hypothetical protein JB92DRAFT_3133291 [Gautieria morchelliformis]
MPICSSLVPLCGGVAKCRIDFTKGILTILKWTGHEHKEMECVFASLIYGAVPPHITAAARADALGTFHQNKQVFIDHHIQTHFQIPKIHMMEHYVALIHSKGSTDGFNTKLSEHLHIDCAKEGYHASNKNHYTEQMIKYLTCHEAVDAFKHFLACDHESDRPADIAVPLLSPHSTKWQLTNEPPYPNVSLEFLKDKYGAVNIVLALTTYLVTKVPGCHVTPSNYDLVNVYAQILRSRLSPQCLTDETQKDSICATPFWHECTQAIPQHFDTALVHDDLEAQDVGLKAIMSPVSESFSGSHIGSIVIIHWPILNGSDKLETLMNHCTCHWYHMQYEKDIAMWP